MAARFPTCTRRRNASARASSSADRAVEQVVGADAELSPGGEDPVSRSIGALKQRACQPCSQLLGSREGGNLHGAKLSGCARSTPTFATTAARACIGVTSSLRQPQSVRIGHRRPTASGALGTGQYHRAGKTFRSTCESALFWESSDAVASRLSRASRRGSPSPARWIRWPPAARWQGC
jgi:hypothetical protein